MPKVKEVAGYIFRFYSRGEAGERPHIHVLHDHNEAKFWLLPATELAHPGRFKPHELTRIERLVREHRAEFLEA